MAAIQVIQRNAHLAGPVRYDMVEGREGKIARAIFIAISNTRRGAGDAREDEPTSIQWTLWDRQAENAARYLGTGSHVNVVGWVRNHRYEKDGATVYGLDFTADEVDYLDTRAEREAREGRQAFVADMQAHETSGQAPARDARPARRSAKA
ncbi:single-stranded DNA-binding protein [Rubrivivax albus]|uniref:Single-stranded DNA-binding protein n=1 Tax=Rubrivivax albus TaxID=2499835 RepID=A0A3S2VV26_9BURK|nr:single-stranded DNA-binding protein [Rubrivivax albus]RVT49591.1 single-stranded DNA-binding protein [Rubrivivax albus]